MNANELREKINAATRMIADTIPKAETEADAQMATLMGIGIEILGEFLMDVKRIADAAERLPGPQRATKEELLPPPR